MQWLLNFLSGGKPCSHDWEITFADRITFAPKERRCKKCGTIQVAHISWITKCQK